jgi:hypothetical protein
MSSKQYKEPILNAANGAANIASIPFIETTFLERWTGSVVVTPSAATLSAALRFFGSSLPSAIGALTAADQAVMTNANFIVAKSTLDAGITIANGVITFLNPTAATHVFQFTFGDAPLPMAIRPDYAFTSGGGTVTLALNLHAYGLNS